MKELLVASGILVLFFSSCGSSAQHKVCSSLKAADFKKKMEADTHYVVLDVRTFDEFEKGYIPQAIHLDYYSETFGDKIRELDPNQTIYVYCEKGGRSRMTLDTLRNNGFKRIYELKGGFDAWRSQDYPIAKPQ